LDVASTLWGKERIEIRIIIGAAVALLWILVVVVSMVVVVAMTVILPHPVLSLVFIMPATVLVRVTVPVVVAMVVTWHVDMVLNTQHEGEGDVNDHPNKSD
jgi:hypothetical protein